MMAVRPAARLTWATGLRAIRKAVAAIREELAMLLVDGQRCLKSKVDLRNISRF